MEDLFLNYKLIKFKSAISVKRRNKRYNKDTDFDDDDVVLELSHVCKQQ